MVACEASVVLAVIDAVVFAELMLEVLGATIEAVLVEVVPTAVTLLIMLFDKLVACGLPVSCTPSASAVKAKPPTCPAEFVPPTCESEGAVGAVIPDWRSFESALSIAESIELISPAPL